MIKGDQVWIYKSGGQWTLIEGYPKPLAEELGVEGPISGAFVCDAQEPDTVFILKGDEMMEVDLSATPRTAAKNKPLSHLPGLGAGLCNAEGVVVFKGPTYYEYGSPMIMSMGRIAAEPNPITPAIVPCKMSA